MKGDRHALVVGIDHYPLLGKRFDLEGSRNDAALMADLLRDRFRFAEPEVLLDREATRDGIAQALMRLLDRVGPGDVAVFHYSGHGSRILPAAGSDTPPRETLVPYDSGRGPGEGRDLVDLELRRWLRRLVDKGASATLIFDCCHSGSLVRDARGARVRQIPEAPDDTPRALPWDLPGDLTSSTPHPPLRNDPLRDYSLIAACRADQLAFEIAGEGHGALTFFLAQALLRGGTELTYRDLHERLTASITRCFPSQQPQLEGRRDRRVFGLREIVPRAYFEIGRHPAGRLEVAAGTVHGCTPGARFRIAPPGTKDPSSHGTLGRVELTTVRAVRSQARVVAGCATLPTGSRAFLESLDNRRLCLAIALDPSLSDHPWHGRLETLLWASPLLRCARPGDHATVRIQCLPADGVPRSARSWGRRSRRQDLLVASDGAGVAVLPPQPSGPTPDLEAIRTGLVRLARYRNLLGLESLADTETGPTPIELRLWVQPPGGPWRRLDPPGRAALCREGDFFGIEIANRSRRPGFVQVLDLGPTGRVEVLHPVPGVREALPAGRTLRLGMPPDDERFEVRLPNGSEASIRELHVPRTNAPRPRALEFLKIFATPEATDLSVFEQDPFRRERPSPHPTATQLERLFHSAWFGSEQHRRIRCRPLTERPLRDRWLALTRCFEIAPR